MTLTNRAVQLPSAAQPLFILAMDHRASLGRDLFGVTGDPTPRETSEMRDAKGLVFEADALRDEG